MLKRLFDMIKIRSPPNTMWKNFVREILLEVYGADLMHYTVRGTRGNPKVAPQLLKGLHRE